MRSSARSSHHAELLCLGIFGGKYMTDCRDEFPSDWFVGAKLSP